MIDDYISFVQETIQKYSDVGDLIRGDQVHPQELNRALALYFNANLSLNAEYQRAKAEQLDLELQFEEWWDTKFEEARDQILKEYEESRSIKPAVKEFESRARNANREAYTSWKRKLAAAENKTRFLLRLLDLFKKYDNILTTISQNMRSELRSLSLEDRMNKDPKENKVRAHSGRRLVD